MILEGLVTTRNADGTCNLAPMGPVLSDEEVEANHITGFVLRPFTTSRTYKNLRRHGEGVLHVTDDVLLLAQAAISDPRADQAPSLPGTIVTVNRLMDCCRYFEFRVLTWIDVEPRGELHAQVLHEGQVRPFFGLNRAKHAVVEAAILATRLGLLAHQEIIAEFARLAIPVQKTGGARELRAFALLQQYVAQWQAPHIS